MEPSRAVDLLQALAQETRLATFRLLIRAGPGGVPAGVIARTLDIAPPVLSFHLAYLARSGLVTSHRDGRHVIYTAAWDVMENLLGFLTRNCCQGVGQEFTGTATATGSLQS